MISELNSDTPKYSMLCQKNLILITITKKKSEYQSKVKTTRRLTIFLTNSSLVRLFPQSVRSRHFSAVKKCLMRHMTSAKVQVPKTLLIISTQSIKNFPCLNSATSLSSTSDLFRETITIRESIFRVY